MKIAVFCEVTPCGSFKNRRFTSIIGVKRISEPGTTLAAISNNVLVAANIVPRSLILFTLMM
jgi:hypothetical protein